MNAIELEKDIEKLSIQVTMNLAHIRTLEMGLKELASHLLSPSESMNFLAGHFDALYEQNVSLLSKLTNEIYASSIQKELFDLHCYVSTQKKGLLNQD